MSFHGTPIEIADELGYLFANLRDALKAAEAENIRIARAYAERLSQGGLSLATLRRMGHPYARTDPHPPYDAGIINRQTGVFLRSFRTDQRGGDSDTLRTNLRNVSPEWRYLKKGTKRMIARPLGQLVKAAIKKDRKQVLRDAIRHVLHP